MDLKKTVLNVRFIGVSAGALLVGWGLVYLLGNLGNSIGGFHSLAVALPSVGVGVLSGLLARD